MQKGAQAYSPRSFLCVVAELNFFLLLVSAKEIFRCTIHVKEQ